LRGSLQFEKEKREFLESIAKGLSYRVNQQWRDVFLQLNPFLFLFFFGGDKNSSNMKF
jgi:hypothetical protein